MAGEGLVVGLVWGLGGGVILPLVDVFGRNLRGGVLQAFLLVVSGRR